MHKSKQFLVIVLLLGAVSKMRAEQVPVNIVHMQQRGITDVDAMLDDDTGLLSEPIHIKPISSTERWMRMFGGAILLNYLAFKEYMAGAWSYFGRDKDLHEHQA